MSYNLTQLQNANNTLDIVTYANESTGGVFLGIMVIGIFFITLFVLKKWEFDEALFPASFICFVISAILTYTDLLNFIFPLLFLTISAFTGLYLFTAKRR